MSDEPLRVLFVDDELNILKTMARLFREESFEVLTANSGQEGLNILRATANVGLIISDQRMPGMTGTVFLQAASEILPDTPRMILTGYSDVNAAIDAINHGGATRFLMKPWNENELRLAVRDGLQPFDRQGVRPEQQRAEPICPSVQRGPGHHLCKRQPRRGRLGHRRRQLLPG